MIYLTYADLLHVAERVTGAPALVRDAGLLEMAAARPRSTVFGADAYLSLDEKASALAHSIARNHPLVDGNERLALGAIIAFLGVNGMRLRMDNDQAYELIIGIAAGELDDVAAIVERLRPAIQVRSPRR